MNTKLSKKYELIKQLIKKAEDVEGPGLFKCKYLPLKGNGAALVDDEEYDFPEWRGDPLPPVDWP